MITKNYIAKGEGANRFEKVPVRIYEKPSEVPFPAKAML